MKHPKAKEQWNLLGKCCFVKHCYTIEYTGVLVIKRVHRLLMFKGTYDSAKKKRVPVSVPAIITGFGFGFNGTRSRISSYDETCIALMNRKRVDYIQMEKSIKFQQNIVYLKIKEKINDSPKKQ